MSRCDRSPVGSRSGRLITARSLLALGYGNCQLGDVLALLRANEVRYLIDVRSVPCSRFNPVFSKNSLATAVEKTGIHIWIRAAQYAADEALGERKGARRFVCRPEKWTWAG
jgi:uncharacterized protein (DUF488 family)